MNMLNGLLFAALSKRFYDGFDPSFIFELNVKIDNQNLTDKQLNALKKIYDNFKIEVRFEYFKNLEAEVIMLDTIEPIDEVCENCSCNFELGFLEVKDKLLCI